VSIVVRPAEVDDVDAAVAIFALCGTAQHPERPTPQDRIEQVRRTIGASSTWTLVAADEDRVIGFATATQSREDEGAGPIVPGLCYLDLIFVAPEHWRQGMGAMLLDTVIADARGRGYSRIHLLTHDDNTRAQGLYASRGFARTDWSRMSHDPANGPVSEWELAL
jgi:ribosomal protein S18 acetylase RimI-like enzyme